jgi:transposase
MDVLHSRCCGLDVHKSSISACILLREAGRVQKHQRRFGAMTQELRELAEWLRQFGVTQVAMESSGVYWKPVWNILEGQFTVVLANAQHIKNVPGGADCLQLDAKIAVKPFSILLLGTYGVSPGPYPVVAFRIHY